MVKHKALKRGKKARRGGWQATSRIADDERRRLSSFAHAIEANCLITVMPDTGDDRQRKRSISRTIANVGRDLKRRGRPHYGVTIHEKTFDADLHAHHLCWLDPTDRSITEKFDGSIVNVVFFTARQRAEMTAYASKQRRWLHPEAEARAKKCLGRCYKYQKGAPFVGQRVSWTKAAKALMTEIEAGQATIASGRALHDRLQHVASR